MKLLDVTINTISVVGLLLELACVWLFVAKRKLRELPFVFVFLAYLAISDLSLLVIEREMDVWPALVITTYIGYFFEAAAVWELGCRLLDPSNHSAGGQKIKIPALACLLCAIPTYVMTNFQSYQAFGSEERMFLHLDLTVSVYRVLALIAVLALTRKDAFVKGSLVTRMTIVFALYAVCALLKHIFGELAPKWNLPPTAFSIADSTCSLIWVLLLASLVRKLVRSQSHGIIAVAAVQL